MREESTRLTAKLLGIGEGELFFLLLSILLAEVALVGGVTIAWALHGFANLNLTGVLIPGIHLLGLPLMLAIGLLGLNVFRKSGD